MPISATGSKRGREHGFTLLELMVVITIVGLASAVVVLSMQGSGARPDAEGFAARLLAARDAAIVESRDVAVWISPAASGIERRRRGAWQADRSRAFGPREWRSGTQALVGPEGRQRIVFDTTGTTTPTVVTLDRAGSRATVSVEGDGTIRVGA